MRLCRLLSFGFTGAVLTACASGNVSNVPPRGPAPPPTAHAHFDPYASYGSTPATWSPVVATRLGSIDRPVDPVIDAGRPDYEHAAWSIQSKAAQAGTF